MYFIYKKEKVIFFSNFVVLLKTIYRNRDRNIKNNNLQRDDFDYKLFFDTNRIINSIDII